MSRLLSTASVASKTQRKLNEKVRLTEMPRVALA